MKLESLFHYDANVWWSPESVQRFNRLGSKRLSDIGSHCNDALHTTGNCYVDFCCDIYIYIYIYCHIYSNDLWCFYNQMFWNYNLVRLLTWENEVTTSLVAPEFRFIYDADAVWQSREAVQTSPDICIQVE